MKYTASEIEIMFRKVVNAIDKGASLRSALKLPGTPSSSTFAKWCDNDESMAKRYACATLLRAEVIFEDILNIADENYKDTYVDENGIERTDHDVVQRSKLRIDARKWVLAKMHPTKYGDKLDVTSGNKTIDLPIIVGMAIKNEITPIDELDDLN
jgi:hypothetical protein